MGFLLWVLSSAVLLEVEATVPGMQMIEREREKILHVVAKVSLHID